MSMTSLTSLYGTRLLLKKEFFCNSTGNAQKSDETLKKLHVAALSL